MSRKPNLKIILKNWNNATADDADDADCEIKTLKMKGDKMENKKVYIIPNETTEGTTLPDMGPGVIKEFTFSDEELQHIRNHTFRGQCTQFREAVIELCWLISKKLRLQEICTWLERFLRRFKKKHDGCECGELVSTYWVDEVDVYTLARYMQGINAAPMTFGDITFQRGQLLLTGVNVEHPPSGKKKVDLTFQVHSGKWTTAPKVMVRRWWGGYKFMEIECAPILSHVAMQALINYLQALQRRANNPSESVKSADRN